jgi:hypothetical protein
MIRNQVGLPEWEDSDWELLLCLIEDQKVIPIVGRDLSRASPTPGEAEVQLYPYIAQKLKKSLPRSTEPEPETLSDVVCAYLANPVLAPLLPSKIQAILREVEGWAVPCSLALLARITDFHFFVTTTFDHFLRRAIEGTTLDGHERETQFQSYDPRPLAGQAIGDLATPALGRTDSPWDERRPIVYHLLGRVETQGRNAMPRNVVLSDEDLIEMICALNSEDQHREPTNLLNELATNHLLLLGCSFSDWLARFFLRAPKQRRRHLDSIDNRPITKLEYIVDDFAPQDRNMVLFVQNFKNSSRIYRTGNVIEFVKELHKRWSARHPEEVNRAAVPKKPPIPQREKTNAKPDRGKLFISYPHEDMDIVRRFKARLAGAGIHVWVDEDDLKGGDRWAPTIRKAIEACTIFMPVVSKASERRVEGYFRREWKMAVERNPAHFGARQQFIWPVVFDGTATETALVPEEFLETQWTRLPDGQPDEEFIHRLKAALEIHEKR